MQSDLHACCSSTLQPFLKGRHDLVCLFCLLRLFIVGAGFLLSALLHKMNICNRKYFKGKIDLWHYFFYRMWEAILTLAFVFWEEHNPIPFFLRGTFLFLWAAFQNIVHTYCYCMSGYRRIDKKSTKTIQRTNKNCRKTNYACLLLDNIR